jgi:hypothetical protein
MLSRTEDVHGSFQLFGARPVKDAGSSAFADASRRLGVMFSLMLKLSGFTLCNVRSLSFPRISAAQ